MTTFHAGSSRKDETGIYESLMEAGAVRGRQGELMFSTEADPASIAALYDKVLEAVDRVRNAQ